MYIEELNINKTSRLYENLFEPIYDLLRDHTINVSINYQKGETFLKQLSNDCSRTIQNFTMQLILFTIEYLFSQNDFKFSLRKDKQFIPLAVTQIVNLKKHFFREKNPQVNLIVQSIHKILTNKNENFDNKEGFYSSDEESQQKSGNSDFFVHPTGYYSHQFQEKQEKIRENDNMIIALKQKLIDKENQLADLTTGYLKDLQNMREQIFRSNINEDEEFYEVKYFDIFDIEDSRYLQLLNAKISDLKNQYEKRTLDLVKKNYQQKAVIQNFQKQLQVLNERVKNFDNPEYLLNRTLHLERNPYIIWKMIQDWKGNFFFEEVFERQRNTYGINYAEVNQLLMKNKAYDRNYALFKSGIEDQLVNFIDSVQEPLKNLKDENHRLKKELEELTENMLNCKRIFIKETTNEIFNSMEKWKKKQLETIQQKFFSEFNQQKDFMIQRQRFALKTLGVAAQVSKFLRGKSDWVSVKQLIGYAQDKNSMQELKFLRQKNIELFEQIQEEQKQNAIIQIQIASTQWSQETVNSEITVLKENIRNFQDQLINEVNYKKELQIRIMNAEKFNKAVIKSIDQLAIQSVIQEMDENGEIRDKKFTDKLKTLSRNMIRLILELQEQKQKNEIALTSLINIEEKKDQSVLTDLCNVKIQLGFIIQQSYSSKNLQTSQVIQQNNQSPLEIPQQSDQILVNINTLQNTEKNFQSIKTNSRNSPIQPTINSILEPVQQKIQDTTQQSTQHLMVQQINKPIELIQQPNQNSIKQIIIQKTVSTQTSEVLLQKIIVEHQPKDLINLKQFKINQPRIQVHESDSYEKDHPTGQMPPICENRTEDDKFQGKISVLKTNGESKSSEDEVKLQTQVPQRRFSFKKSLDSTPSEYINQLSLTQVQTNREINKCRDKSTNIKFEGHKRNRIIEQKYKIQNQVFQRLFDDQFKRQERIDNLKKQLSKLEEQQFIDTSKLIDLQDESFNFLDQVMQSKQYYQDKLISIEKLQERFRKNDNTFLTQIKRQNTSFKKDFSLTTSFNFYSPKGVIPIRSRAEFYFQKPKEIQELDESFKNIKKEKPKFRKTRHQVKSLMEKQNFEQLIPLQKHNEKFLITDLSAQIQCFQDQKALTRNIEVGIQPEYTVEKKMNISY